MPRYKLLLLSLFTALFVSASASYGQTGTITGQVFDPAGAAVNNAQGHRQV